MLQQNKNWIQERGRYGTQEMVYKKLGLINTQHNRYETIIRENHIHLYTLKNVM